MQAPQRRFRRGLPCDPINSKRSGPFRAPKFIALARQSPANARGIREPAQGVAGDCRGRRRGRGASAKGTTAEARGMRRSGIMDGASVGRSAAPTIYYNMDCTIYTLECIIHSIEYRGMRHRSNRGRRKPGDTARGIMGDVRGDAASRPAAPPVAGIMAGTGTIRPVAPPAAGRRGCWWPSDVAARESKGSALSCAARSLSLSLSLPLSLSPSLLLSLSRPQLLVAISLALHLFACFFWRVKASRL